MSEIKKISKYLLDYQELWRLIKINEPVYPLHEYICELLNSDCYKIDLSGNNSVYQLFHVGSLDFVPVICFPKNKKVNLDECPVYIFDFNNAEIEKIGNFKFYMKEIIEGFIRKKKVKLLKDDENDVKFYKSEAKKALKDLSEFSDKLIKYDYEIKLREINDEDNYNVNSNGESDSESSENNSESNSESNSELDSDDDNDESESNSE